MNKNTRKNIEEIMINNPELKDKLFARGFLFTDANVDEKGYPFYELWQKKKIDKYTVFVASKQSIYVKEKNGVSLILIGHAYDPFSMCASEVEILEELLDTIFMDEKFREKLNQITGVFTLICIQGNKVYVVGDCTCMQTTFYGKIYNQIYVASHTNLIGDLLNLKYDEYVKKLSEYRFFSMLGNALPGDLTQFQEVKRLVPNHYMKVDENKNITVKRFYWPQILKIDMDKIVLAASDILYKNLKLISKKWEHPAISMTGGCDSKTTLSCASGIYDKFSYFSYTSSESEDVDANAAHSICKALNLEHEIYTISQKDEEFDKIEEIRSILEWNTGNIIPVNKNDVRKRAFFADTQDFDVEVKSWVSEVGRSYYSKRFNGRTKFGDKPTPRKCTTMYKFFLNNRKLVRQTDKVFKEYLDKYFEQVKENPVEWQEQLFWEYRIPSWNGLVITGEHRYSFDITIPYNNRHLLELLLSVPIEQRINDTIYSQIRKKREPIIDETGIAITNLKHTKKREKAENLYYLLHSKIPF